MDYPRRTQCPNCREVCDVPLVSAENPDGLCPICKHLLVRWVESPGRELKAMQDIHDALCGLTADQQRRIMRAVMVLFGHDLESK